MRRGQIPPGDGNGEPDGPDPELAHGPQIFASAQEALDWCDAQLGAPTGPQRENYS